MPQSWSGAQHAFYPRSSWPGSMANLQSNTSHATKTRTVFARSHASLSHRHRPGSPISGMNGSRSYRHMTDTTITHILGRRVWDSRGRPTVEAEVTLASGARGRAIAPAGGVPRRAGGAGLRDGGEGGWGPD